jgi:MFS transporter, DHA1 family, chloramphenicol resistance protein
MPLAVVVLGFSAFVLGTSEFMLTGLLPQIASDLEVSIPDAGLLISAYAVGMFVGAPVMAAATLKLPRKLTLLAMQATFLVGHVVGALAPTYGVLFGTRMISAFAQAGFMAVAFAITINLVPVDRRGRAMATLIGGITVATVIGVPAGTFVAQQAGWRSTFWVVAALCAITGVVVLRVVPSVDNVRRRPRLRAELGAYRNPRLWLALTITSLTIAATFATASYLAPVLTDVTGLHPHWVPVVLSLFGVGSVIGIGIGGRLADRHPLHALAGGVVGTGVALVALALGARTAPVAVAAILLLGLAGFVVNPALNVRAFALAATAPTLGGASNISAFNVGLMAAPWLGGLTIDAGLGYLSVTWVSFVLAVVALAGIVLAAKLDRAATQTQAPKVVRWKEESTRGVPGTGPGGGP